MSDDLKTLIRGALRSRLVRVGVALIVIALLQVFTHFYGEYLSADVQGLITAFIGAVIIALRADTRQPLIDKGRKPPSGGT